MEAILALIVSYFAIWAPALTAIFGIVFSVIKAIGKVSTAINEAKAEVARLKGEQEVERADHNEKIAELEAKIEAYQTKLNAILTREDLLLDQLTKIQGYAEAIEKERHRNETV